MGSAISDEMKAQQERNDAETLEQLQMLNKMMVNKVEAASSKMKDDAYQDKSLPIVAIVDTAKKYTVKVKNVPDEDIMNGVKEILSGDFIGGLVSLLSVGLNQFLGNTAAGDSEMQDFHVVFANNSLLRVDYMLYNYNFSSKGIKDEYQNGFCYYSQIGVLDLKKVNPQVLLYELTRAVGEKNLQAAKEQLKSLASVATELYSVVNTLGEAAVDHDKGSEEDNEKEEGNPDVNESRDDE